MNDDVKGMHLSEMKTIALEIDILVEDIAKTINDIRKYHDEFFDVVNNKCQVSNKLDNSFSIIDNNFSVVLNSISDLTNNLKNIISIYENTNRKITTNFCSTKE